MAKGELLRRLIIKVLLAQGPMRRAAAGIEPNQCGLGIKGACDRIDQAIGAIFCELDARMYMEPQSNVAAHAQAVIQVDLSNYFNCVSLSHILQAFVDSCPKASTGWPSYDKPAHPFLMEPAPEQWIGCSTRRQGGTADMCQDR